MRSRTFFVLLLGLLLLQGCGDSNSFFNLTSSEPESQPAVEVVSNESAPRPGNDRVNPPEPGSLVGQSVVSYPDTGLVNQSGESVSFSSLPDKPVLVGFIYTRCPMPKMCPLISYKFRQVQKTLNEAEGEPVHLVLITFDPEYDTPEVLREYGEKRGIEFSNFEFWTGPSETIDRVTGKFKILARKGTTQDGNTVYSHNLRIYLLDREGVVRYWYRGSDWKVQDVAAHLRELS